MTESHMSERCAWLFLFELALYIAISGYERYGQRTAYKM